MEIFKPFTKKIKSQQLYQSSPKDITLVAIKRKKTNKRRLLSHLIIPTFPGGPGAPLLRNELLIILGLIHKLF